MSKTKKRLRFSVLGLGTTLVFLSLVSLVFYLFFKIKFQEKSVPNSISDSQQKEGSSDLIANSNWENYTNNDYGFSISHPQLLLPQEYKDQGGYKDFIVFEETKYSLGKGIAVGVSDSSLDVESQKIKNQMQQFKDAKLVKEEKFKLGDYDAIHLEYHAADSKNEEDRAVVIIQKDNLSYSISTVPEQIDRALASFKFL